MNVWEELQRKLSVERGEKVKGELETWRKKAEGK
jgi:hypothetical protein